MLLFFSHSFSLIQYMHIYIYDIFAMAKAEWTNSNPLKSLMLVCIWCSSRATTVAKRLSECVNMSCIMCGALHVYRINVAIAGFYVFAVRGVRINIYVWFVWCVCNFITTYYCTAWRPTFQLQQMSVVYFMIFFFLFIHISLLSSVILWAQKIKWSQHTITMRVFATVGTLVGRVPRPLFVCGKKYMHSNLV